MARNFCGIVDSNDDPSVHCVEAMANALNFSNLYHIESKGLPGCKLANIHSKRISADFIDKTGVLPSHFEIVSFSFLQRKEELCIKLGLSGHHKYSDEQLILFAFLKWGRACVHHLYGDWSFAIWDRKGKELFLARNPHASGMIYYYKKEGRLYFSSQIAGLLALKEIPKVINSEKFFKECLKVNGVDNETLYSHIFTLKPGHWAVFSKKGLESYQYWQLAHSTGIYYGREHYAQKLFALLDQAVGYSLALSNNWTLTLSGGKDSSALLTMVMEQRAKVQRQLNSLFYFDDLSAQDLIPEINAHGERDLIYELKSHYPAMNLSLISGHQSIDAFTKDFTATFKVPPYTANLYYSDTLARAVYDSGGYMVLNAQGGNETISFDGLSPTSSLTQLRTDQDQGYSSESLDYVKGAFGSLRHLAKKSGRKWLADRFISANAILNRDFVESVNGHELIENHLYSNDGHISLGKQYFLRKLRPGSHERLGAWNMMGSKYDIQFIDPSIDIDLIQMINTVPNHIFNSNGKTKRLYEDVFSLLMPEKIVQKKNKWSNMPSLVKRYKDDLELIMNRLNDPSNYADALDKKRIYALNHKLLTEKNTITHFNNLTGSIGSMLLALYIRSN
jgi:asparagine synthase (glutamine-hydrolysing)